MRPAFYARNWLRESRGTRARLLFFAACLALGVAAVVAVAGFSAALREAVRREARTLLAADVVVEARRALPPEIDELLAARPDLVVASVRELSTMASAPASGSNGAPGPSLLAELKAVEGPYPHYGELVLSPPLGDGETLEERLGADGAVVAPELAQRLRLELGATLSIGGEAFQVRGIVEEEPDRTGFGLFLGPRLFVSAAGLARTPLEGFGSRVRHKRLVRLPATATGVDVEALEDELHDVIPPAQRVRVRTKDDSQPALGRGFDRVEAFLGLVALLSLWIGGIGVAQTVRAWLASRLDAIAVQKCLGLRPREVLFLYVGQTLLLGFLGSLAGAALGVSVQLVLPVFLGDLLPVDVLDWWQPLAVLRGLGLGTGVAFFFSLFPLLGVLAVTPARVLRRDAEPLKTPATVRLLAAAVLLAGVLATASVQAQSLVLGAQFTGGMAVVALLLAGGARGVMLVVARLPRERFGVSLRHGLSALARPGAGTVGAVVAQGVGVLVVLAMFLVESRLATELSTAVPADAPTAFLVDIQPSQWPGVARILDEEGATNVESVPVVTARLASIDGRGVDEIAAERREQGRGGRPRWVLTREQRITWMRALPADNEVVRGALWSRPDVAEMSLEEGFAEDLGVDVGARLAFDLQGVPVEFTVTSIRTVDWQTFGINFFLVAEPGTLDDAPRYRVATVQIPEDREPRVQDRLAGAFPNVTLLRVRELLEKVVGVLRRVGTGVRALGGFTVLAGILILFGAVGATSLRRGRETALFKTIGMTRRDVATLFAVEYGLVGLVAGAIGAVGGTLCAWTVVTRGLELAWRFETLPFVVAVVASAVLSVAAGLSASLRALGQRPLVALRAE